MWRIYSFYIHDHWPTVKNLTFHLPNQQNVLFKDDDILHEVVDKNLHKHTMFTAWFEANKISDHGRDLTYAEFPQRFVYYPKVRKWTVRKKKFAIGRLNFIPPGSGELFYLRLLLNVQRGCTSFESIRTFKGVIYPTFKEACIAMKMLKNNKKFIVSIKPISKLGSGHQLKRLFASI